MHPSATPATRATLRLRVLDLLCAGPSLPAPSFGHELLRRWLPWMWLKALGTTAFMWVFFVGYFALMRRPDITPTVMPLTALDRWLPAEPLALWPYLSLWLYVSLPASLLPRLGELLAHGVAWAALLATGLLLFYLWPTMVPPPDVDLGAHPGFALLRGVDSGGNACPSMHVASATFAVAWLHRLLHEMRAARWWQALNALWFVAIVWSTLAVRQHVLVDVLAGAALGALFVLPSLAAHRRVQRLSSRPFS